MTLNPSDPCTSLSISAEQLWTDFSPTEFRFWSKVDVGDCWEWTAHVDRGGYGRFWPTRRVGAMAHRFAYELLVGPIPAGLDLDHLCKNRKCVSPAHLEPVTRRVNCQRGALGAVSGARMRARTHCPYGHPLDGRTKNGWRFCKTCHAKSKAARYLRDKALNAPLKEAA